MRPLRLLTYLLAALAGCAALHTATIAQSTTVYVVQIQDEVDLSMAPYVRRAISEALDAEASAIVFRINTFGGRVDVATEVKDAILNVPIPTIAFIDKRAISAGALIALSTSKIAMTPGSSIGAATPVYDSGEKAPEKVVSYMRGEMRATAERHKRDPRIAEAMVDESVQLDDSILKRSGKLLTLTTDEAVRIGYCDIEANSLEDALAKLGYSDPEIVSTDLAWGEALVKFLAAPVISSILIMLGMGGIFYTVKTGHFSSITVVGVVAIALFFGAGYLADLTNFVEVLMFVMGIGLLIAEIFVIPGFGVAGISGIVMVVASLFMALIGKFDLMSTESLSVPLYTLAASFLGLAILVGLMFRYLPASRAFDRFVLTATQSSAAGYVSAPDYSSLLGMAGAALTTLRPAGMAQLGSDRFDVISSGEWIQAGEPVKVVHVEGRKIVVTRV